MTLEYVETPGEQTRLAQAFRLILIQLPAHGPTHTFLELTEVWPHVKPGGIVVVDDILPDPDGFDEFLRSCGIDSGQTVRLGPVGIMRRPG